MVYSTEFFRGLRLLPKLRPSARQISARYKFLKIQVLVVFSLAAVSESVLADTSSHLEIINEVFRSNQKFSAALGNSVCDIPGERLTLDRAMAIAICRNPRVGVAEASIRQQMARVSAAASEYKPSLDLQVNSQRTGPSNTLSNDSSHALSVEAALNWLIFDFGGRLEKNRSEQLLLEAAMATRRENILAVAIDVADRYFSAAIARGLLVARQELEDAANDSSAAAEAKTVHGIGSRADLLQAQSAYSQAKMNRIAASSDYMVAIGSLATEMSVPLESKLDLEDLASPIMTAFTERTLQMFLSEADQANPYVSSAAAVYEAARHRLLAAEARRYPNVSTFASRRWIESRKGTGDVDASTIGLQLSFSIFDGGLIKSAENLAKADLEERKFDAMDARRLTAAAVWTAFRSMQSSAERFEESKKLNDVCKESFGVAMGRYKAGVGTIIEVLSAQNALAQARQQQLESIAQWHRDKARLAAAIGRLSIYFSD